MNPQAEIAELKRQVAELTKTVNSLYRSQAIPLDLVKSFVGRGFVNGKTERLLDITTNEGFRRVATVVGSDVEVPAYPYAFIKIEGTNYYIPLHVYAEFV